MTEDRRWEGEKMGRWEDGKVRRWEGQKVRGSRLRCSR